MLDPVHIAALLTDIESDLVERKESLTDKDRVMQAVCAFANDLPNHREPGYIIIGANDAGATVGLDVSDQMLRTLADMRDRGKILPLPHLDVQKVKLGDHFVAVVRVNPSDSTPVRLDGQVWIRVGPRRAIASAEEERRLTEKSTAANKTFDRRPCVDSSLDDLLLDTFRNEYLPFAVSRDIISQNHRDITAQMASLRLYDLRA